MKRGSYFLLVAGAGKTVGRTVWTVCVTGMEVDLPDIWVAEKETIAVVVVNELVIPWLNAVEVESFVVSGASTRATWLGLNRLDQTGRKAWRYDVLRTGAVDACEGRDRDRDGCVGDKGGCGERRRGCGNLRNSTSLHRRRGRGAVNQRDT